MGFDFVKKSRIEGITSLNSKAGHFNFLSVDHFNINGVNITAPGNSPNTDGIKISLSSNIKISNTHISTGDDCIAVLSGNTNFDIYNVTCGPGHGISVGSLGKNKDEKNVDGLTVKNTVFTSTTNGIRIKTWEYSASTIVVSNFVYENIQMINVKNPIIIDQKYCPYPPCKKLVTYYARKLLSFKIFMILINRLIMIFAGRFSHSDPKRDVKEHLGNFKKQSGC